VTATIRPLTPIQQAILRDLARQPRGAATFAWWQTRDQRSGNGLFARGLVETVTHCGCGHPCGCAHQGVQVTALGYQVLRDSAGIQGTTTPTQRRLLELAAQVGRLYRDGSSVYGYTASGGYVTAKAPGDSLFGLVRSGLLVRRVDPKNPLCAWFERTERTEGGRG
jgi:hypothetical protein